MTRTSTPQAHAERIAAAARELGFARVAFSPVAPFERGSEALGKWLAAGQHGEMRFMSRHRSVREDPRQLLEGARSLVVVALNYGTPADAGPAAQTRDASAASGLTGFVARYARGRDYHAIFKERLYALAERCQDIVARPVMARPCVDSAPLFEREAAHRSGLGFIAKSTMAIVPGLGSYVLLGELLLDVELAYGSPAQSKCGQCTACLDACPTGAFPEPFVLDARRCISYLTIELQGPIPRHLRPLIGTMVFGCDICQQVCPFNASPKPRPVDPELQPRAELQAPDLVAWLNLTSAGYRRLVSGTALRRASRTQLARNAAVALGNTADADAIEPLVQATREHKKALVRGHAAWALGELGGARACDTLQSAARNDPDASVREEASHALQQCGSG